MAGATQEMPNPGNVDRLEKEPCVCMLWLKYAWCKKARILGLQESNRHLVRLLANA